MKLQNGHRKIGNVKSRLLYKTKRISAVILSALIVCGFGRLSCAVAEDSVSSKSVAAKDSQVFMGRWIRPDGGYVLELNGGQAEGTLEAVYYNPKPIHVAHAELARDNGFLTIFIELRDINYPGSTYHLIYDDGADRLVGTYFQAVNGITYDIMFVRDE